MKVTFRFVYEDKRSSWCSEDVGCKQSGISFTVRKLCDAVEIAVPFLAKSCWSLPMEMSIGRFPTRRRKLSLERGEGLFFNFSFSASSSESTAAVIALARVCSASMSSKMVTLTRRAAYWSCHLDWSCRSCAAICWSVETLFAGAKSLAFDWSQVCRCAVTLLARARLSAYNFCNRADFPEPFGPITKITPPT